MERQLDWDHSLSGRLAMWDGRQERESVDSCLSCIVPGCSIGIRNGGQNFQFEPLVNELFADSNLVVILKKRSAECE